jgi:cobalamin biosynthesis protein CobT
LRDLQPVTAPRLESEVRRLFEDSGSTLFQQHRKSGSINVGSLGRFGTTDRLFKQRRDVEGIDSAVVIVLDVSGSMFADAGRIRAALPTAALLIRVLQRAGVAVALVTFGDVSSVAIPFNTPTPKALETLRRIDSGGSTNDYAALKQAHDMLLARPESRKVCFVLTDGNGAVDDAKEQVNAGTNLGITTIGIGMELDVSEVYPINITVNRLSTLATASLAKIKLAA